MITFLNSISSPVWFFIGAVVSMLGGAYLSRKKDSAAMTTQNIEGAQIVWDEYKRRIDRLTNRVASLEHNEAMNDHRMREMEIAQGTLKEENSQYKEKMVQKDSYIQTLLAGIEKLTAQALRHDSKPDWMPKEQ